MLLNGCCGTAISFDVRCHMNRFDIFEVAKAGALTQVKNWPIA
jgi:hypothetical protein